MAVWRARVAAAIAERTRDRLVEIEATLACFESRNQGFDLAHIDQQRAEASVRSGRMLLLHRNLASWVSFLRTYFRGHARRCGKRVKGSRFSFSEDVNNAISVFA